MKLLKIFVILCSSLSFNVLASAQDEITHLLNFVASTHCEYERNGSIHTGSEAVEHINKKYAYYSDDIETAEDFIKYSATKSLISGRYYQVHCNDEDPIKSKDWLLNELTLYRQSSALNH